MQVAAFLGAAVLLPTGVLLLVLGLRRPASTDGRTGSPAGSGPVPHRIHLPVPADHRSTYLERQECRLRLGMNYEANLVVVADNLARRPAALRGIAMESADMPIDDLVTVSTYLNGPSTGLDRALRNGAPDTHRSVIACLISGLRRFPIHQGACFGVARRVGVPLDVYLPGRVLIEPAFVRADTRWSTPPANAMDDDEIVFAFWSRTGRQVGALETDSSTVLFASGTSFRVLGVTPASIGGRPGIVFLGEYPRPTASIWVRLPARIGLGENRILAQLRKQIAATQRIEPDHRHAPPELGFTPGFDEYGRPYQEDQEEEPQPVQR